MKDEQSRNLVAIVLFGLWITFYLDKICRLLERLIEMIG